MGTRLRSFASLLALLLAAACGGGGDGGGGGGTGTGTDGGGTGDGGTDDGGTDDGGTDDGGTDDGGTDDGGTDDGGTDDGGTDDGGTGTGTGTGTEEDPGWDEADFDNVYDVGPGQPYLTPSEVPWESLGPSTLVRIHYREEPYRDKWVINTEATEDAPLVVLGIRDQDRRPVISGDDAVTRSELSYWNEVRSVIKIGGSNLPTDSEVPAWVYVEGLEIRNANPSYQFTDDDGATQVYADNAAAVHVEVGDHVTLRDLELWDAGNGLFAGSGSSSLTLSRSYVHGNGIVDSIYEHNSYTESFGILFEYNHYGPPCDGCLGNNLKDRSAGTVIRYNWIEGGNRQLDLVESDYPDFVNDPSYRETFVYGNVLVEPDGAGNSQIIHYGGDGGDQGMYRSGTLHLYNNTVVSTRSGNTTLMRLSTASEQADVRNNIAFVTAVGTSLAITSGTGDAYLRDNWLPAGWRQTHDTLEGTVQDLGNVEGSDPGFEDEGGQDFHLAPGSTCLDAGGELAAEASAHPVTRQYVKHQAGETRPDDGSLDIGAFEGS